MYLNCLSLHVLQKLGYQACSYKKNLSVTSNTKATYLKQFNKKTWGSHPLSDNPR